LVIAWPRFAEQIRSNVDSLRDIPNGVLLDEAFVKINGEQHICGRAVDHEGEVLECYVMKKRDRLAALRFLKKAMKRYGQPKVIVTDRLRSYGAAMRDIGNQEGQNTEQYANNRAENSHQPFRRREPSEAQHCRNSPQLMPQSTTTSTIKDISKVAPGSSRCEMPLSLNGDS